jgi:Fe-Mn family superoxide dismutase
MTRREAIKLLGRGAALIGLGTVKPARAQEAVLPLGAGKTPQPFVLPPLPYAANALEPHFDALTMEIHHSKHHQAYITNANKALAGHPALAPMTGEEILANLRQIDEPLRTTLRNNVGGHVNHSFWWTLLSPNGGGAPGGALAAAIERDLGGFDAFKARFTDAALKRFGSGWAWLSRQEGKLLVHSTANQDSPITEGAVPVIGIDVWEHAYYLKNQNRRADYVEAFWSVVDWERAGRNFAAASA